MLRAALAIVALMSTVVAVGVVAGCDGNDADEGAPDSSTDGWDGERCTRGQMTYEVGEEVPFDNCNVCRCADGGSLMCTAKRCPP